MKSIKSSNLVNGLASVGLITTIACTYRFATFFWRHFLRPFPSIKSKYGGTWAIITGGTGGIGLGMAKLLAKQGVNIVLLARNKERLNKVELELKTCNPLVQVVKISDDAANPDYDKILKAVEGLDISMLLNNVGVHNDIPANIEDMLHGDVDRIIQVNCCFQVKLTALLLPKLKQAKKACILNISSLTAKMDMPMLSVYAATKAFQEHFNNGLAAELALFPNIEVRCLRPGITVSRMSGISTPSLVCPSADDMAYSCLRTIGSADLDVAPYWPHAILDYINTLVPSQLAWSAVRDMHQKKRDEMLKLK